MVLDERQRRPVAQVSESYAVAVVARRRGIDPQELAARIDADRQFAAEVIAGMAGPSEPDCSYGTVTEVLVGGPDWELVAEVRSVMRLSEFGCWNRTGIALDGRTDRNHSGHGWEKLGPHGERRLDLFVFLLAIGIIVSVAPRVTAQAEHGNDADDRGPPAERDVPLLTAAPSAPPAQAGPFLLLA